MDEALARLQEQTGKRLGDPDDPLLVSVRSGARESMPGMLDTVLNLGLNDESVQRADRAHRATSASAGTPTGASCRCSAASCAGSPGERFEDAIKAMKERRRREARHRSRRACPRAAHRRVQADLRGRRPARSSRRTRASSCARRFARSSTRGTASARCTTGGCNRIPDEWGTAVNVQQMVFGNKGDTSASGVAFSRNQTTGAPEPSGDFLQNAQGEDVVSGVRNTRDLSELDGAAARGARAADRHHAHARAPLPRHAGHRVHDRGRHSLHAADPQREAPRAGRRAGRCRHGGRGCADARGGAAAHRREQARRAAAPDVRPELLLHAAGTRGARLARRRQGRASCSPPPRRSSRPRTATR